jgi:hypothetical protein
MLVDFSGVILLMLILCLGLFFLFLCFESSLFIIASKKRNWKRSLCYQF